MTDIFKKIAAEDVERVINTISSKIKDINIKKLPLKKADPQKVERAQFLVGAPKDTQSRNSVINRSV